jgi:hypothetical protein
LNGGKCKRLLKNIDAILDDVFPEDADLRRLFHNWTKIIKTLEYTHDVTQTEQATLKGQLKEFGTLWKTVIGSRHVTAYVHIVVCHSIQLLQCHGSIGRYAQQGFEAAHKVSIT